jgi:hypothetical protein
MIIWKYNYLKINLEYYFLFGKGADHPFQINTVGTEFGNLEIHWNSIGTFQTVPNDFWQAPTTN